MKRLMSIAMAALALGVMAGLAFATAFSVSTTPDPAFVSGSTREITSTPDPLDDDGGDRLKGNCDEIEHADDPECEGPQELEDDPSDEPTPTETGSPDGDISGPCDEAEHANDPRCSGDEERDDSSGSGRGRGRGGDDDDDDDDNSGRGSDDD